MSQFWDPRFFFAQWNQHLIDLLLRQQEDLKKRGKDRQVCILVDDVILTSQAEEQLSHMALRGRHFNISLCMAAVSYTSLPKRVRRALDILFCFSCSMHGDRKILMWEYANNANMASFMLRNLGDHECLVLETNRRRQELKIWKAGLLTPADFQNASCISHAGLRKRVLRAKLSGRRSPDRSNERCGSAYSTQFLERDRASVAGGQTEPILPALCPETFDGGPESDPACSERSRNESGGKTTSGGPPI